MERPKMNRATEETITYYPASVTAVAERSLAARAGVCPGDRLLAVNGHPLRDVIDLRYYASEPEVTFLVERESNGEPTEHALWARRRYGEHVGLSFDEELFDAPLRLCRNRCDFCFVEGMAPNLRPSLYVKDDDYRLSFLHGNYVTLTNLDESDWARIAEQYLSPLYVSVHATEPEVRVGLMRNPRAGRLREQLERLAEMGIEVHTQAVLVPGRNDGVHLDRTVEDLADLYPGVSSFTVVPVGLTRWLNPCLRPYTSEEAAAVLAQVEAWQEKLRPQLGRAFVYASDEWYLRAGVETPSLEAYDGLLPELVENGVGMVRLFEEGWSETQEELAALDGEGQTWVTGTLFAPVLRRHANGFQRSTGIEVEVVPVVNRSFGETVTVAGLLMAEDVLRALKDEGGKGVVVLPASVFRGPEDRSLDGCTPEELAEGLGRPVHLMGEGSIS
jgi:putative radical SAM enzyme (TIGR03279 family)